MAPSLYPVAQGEASHSTECNTNVAAKELGASALRDLVVVAESVFRHPPPQRVLHVGTCMRAGECESHMHPAAGPSPPPLPPCHCHAIAIPLRTDDPLANH